MTSSQIRSIAYERAVFTDFTPVNLPVLFRSFCSGESSECAFCGDSLSVQNGLELAEFLSARSPFNSVS